MTLPFRQLFICLMLALLLPSIFLSAQAQEQEDYKILREIVINEFRNEVTTSEGVNHSGVLQRFVTKERKVALILGACLDQGADFDHALFKSFQGRQVPVSLFVDQGWLKKNADKLKNNLGTKNLLLENHGLNCRPLSVTGKGVKARPGTAGVDEVFEEVERNAREIEAVSGRLPRFYKSGYDYYDDVALKIVSVLGYVSIQGDLKLRANDVESDITLKKFLEKLQPGSIILIPANRPGSAESWAPKLLSGISKSGYEIVSLDEVVNVDDEESR
jgi:peptidoglycan/xylan/chitin deacetylase (PgdA/CDA1 family)